MRYLPSGLIFERLLVVLVYTPAQNCFLWQVCSLYLFPMLFSYLIFHFVKGLSPFLTEGELFSSVSRVARLCEAFWTFAHRSHQGLL